MANNNKIYDAVVESHIQRIKTLTDDEANKLALAWPGGHRSHAWLRILELKNSAVKAAIHDASVAASKRRLRGDANSAVIAAAGALAAGNQISEVDYNVLFGPLARVIYAHKPTERTR